MTEIFKSSASIFMTSACYKMAPNFFNAPNLYASNPSLKYLRKSPNSHSLKSPALGSTLKVKVRVRDWVWLGLRLGMSFNSTRMYESYGKIIVTLISRVICHI